MSSIYPNHRCECGRICGVCNEREADHVGDDKRCPGGAYDELFFDDGSVPDEEHVTLAPPSMFHPGDGFIRCERCHGER